MELGAVLGSRGCREKKLPTAVSMQLFGVVFSTFCGLKKLKEFNKYFSIRTEKLHSIKAKKIFKTIGKYFIFGLKQATDLF